MPADPSAAVRFHLSLNVSDLGKAVQFYRTLFGTPPAKLRDDYAKFELSDPPLVLSLEPHAAGGRGALNHAGFRFASSAALVETQRRLELEGVATQREEGVECCYSRQTKFWVHDPDGCLWEFYTLDEDIEHRGAGQSADQFAPAVSAPPAGAPEPAVWEHRMGQPFQIPHAAESLDEVRLRGTFNVPHSAEERERILDQTLRALRPGGKLLVHVLTADTPLAGVPNLPGPAAYVKHVPVRTELLDALQAAGFTALHLSKFGSGPCFSHEGIDLRETMITGCRPAPEGAEMRSVVYKGPFATVTDDEGRVYQRGERTGISESQWNALSKSAIGEQFVSYPPPLVHALA